MSLLLLWDIDGTVLSSGGAGMKALRRALFHAFDGQAFPEGVEFAGRTDRWIMRQIFARCSIPANEDNFSRLTEEYIRILPAEMANPGARVLEGVEALLEEAPKRGNVAQGLLTGNLRRGAEIKLGHHGLWHHFPFGAFADDSEFRDELGPFGIRRARERHRIDFPPERVWIIGDTPHDIGCARAIGAKSLAVATGSHTVSELAEHRPNAVLGDLTDSEKFWSIIGD
jgi:phosphoglycolate phosphatase-like HAD superfamily hydrolase